MTSSLNTTIVSLIYILPAILLALTFHEFAHGYVSYRLGDPTPKTEGRLSFNPLRHLDPVGTLFLIIFKFGWAKPVQVNPYYYKNPKRDMAIVAAAGPLTNFVLAFVSFIFMAVIAKSPGLLDSAAANFIYQFLYILALINIGLGIFNLLPFPPLDGSKVLGAILPENLYFSYMRFEQYGFIVIMLLLFAGVLTGPLNTLRIGLINMMQTGADILTSFMNMQSF